MKKCFLIFNLLIALSINVISQGFGQKNGPWSSAYPNGSIKGKGQFTNNVPYGEFTYYYENGKLKATVIFSNNGLTAYNTTFYKSGNFMTTGKYINQLKDSVWNYYADSLNKLVSSETYISGNLEGEAITYFPGTKQKAEVIEYVKGIKQGILKKYFPDGSLMTDGTYVNDFLEGPFTLYYPDGKIQLKGKYAHGEQVGEWKYFDENGKEMSYEDFSRQSSQPIDVEDPDKSNNRR